MFCGVPHGSVLELLLFTLFFTTANYTIMYMHMITEVYLSASTADIGLYLTHIGDCVSDLCVKRTNYRLRLNANKTDLIIIGTSRKRSTLTSFFPTPILNHSTTPSHTLQNLGATFDAYSNFRNKFL